MSTLEPADPLRIMIKQRQPNISDADMERVVAASFFSSIPDALDLIIDSIIEPEGDE